MAKCLVQIYEVQTPAEAGMLLEMGVDHIGSVLFSEHDWRQPQIKAVIDYTDAPDNKVTPIRFRKDMDKVREMVNRVRLLDPPPP